MCSIMFMYLTTHTLTLVPTQISECTPNTRTETRIIPDFLPVPPPKHVNDMPGLDSHGFSVPAFPHVSINESCLYNQVRASKELQTVISRLECSVKRITDKSPYNDSWSEPHAGSFLVRGPSYLSNGSGRGTKRPSKSSLFSIIGVDSTKNSGATSVKVMSQSEESYRTRFVSALMSENASREAKKYNIIPQQVRLCVCVSMF